MEDSGEAYDSSYSKSEGNFLEALFLTLRDSCVLISVFSFACDLFWSLEFSDSWPFVHNLRSASKSGFVDSTERRLLRMQAPELLSYSTTSYRSTIYRSKPYWPCSYFSIVIAIVKCSHTGFYSLYNFVFGFQLYLGHLFSQIFFSLSSKLNFGHYLFETFVFPLFVSVGRTCLCLISQVLWVNCPVENYSNFWSPHGFSFLCHFGS